MDVNYKKVKRYKTAKYPIRQPWYLMLLIWVLSKLALMGKKFKIEKINMKGLKPPYMILSTHNHFIDFELTALGTFPHRVNNVVNIDGYYQRPWLMEWIGAICTRKFTNDMHLIRSIKKVLMRGDILCMYPEARYSPCGTDSFLPDSLGRLVKMCKVPVVAVVHRGNHLYAPFWNFRKKRKVSLHTTIKQILTADDIASLSPDEIMEILKRELKYDDYKYQKDNNIKITEKFRAEGLHKALYQCPHCTTESKMASEGAEIFCTECGKRWTLNEDGTLSANNGETEFSHVPDWFEWEREQVHAQIDAGTYSFADEADVYSMPGCWKFPYLGKAVITHDSENGFIIEGHYNGSDYRIQRRPLEINSLHIEYDWFRIKKDDCIDISTENDSFYCYLTKKNIVTKLGFATEIIHQNKLAEVKRSRVR